MRPTLSLAAMTLIIAAESAISVSPSFAGDVAQGEQLARRWCSTCHLVSRDQTQASADGPPFSAIARMPNFSAEKIAFFLLDPHPKMPPLTLSRREADDIAAYIGSLAK